MSRGKKYAASLAGIDRQHLYSASEAVDLVKSSAKASFDETVELAIRLGVDPRLEEVGPVAEGAVAAVRPPQRRRRRCFSA